MKTIATPRLLMIALTTLAVGCTQNFEEINTSPVAPASVPAEYLLTQAQLSGITADGDNNWQVGSWIQQWASGSLSAPSQYLEDRDLYETNNWRNHYDLIKNLAQIRNRALKGQEDTPNGRTKLAIAKIYETFIWQRMTDFWGDIPYTQAGMPDDNLALLPRYDKQEDIYRSLISNLDGAVAQLNRNDVSFGAADIVYKGDIEKWRKFANVLKLRMGMRIRFADPALAQKTVTEALAGPVFVSNADNAAMPTNTLDGNALGYHPIIASYNSSKELNQMAAAFVDALQTRNDPRLPRIAEPTENSKKAGKPVYRGLGVALGGSVIINRDDYSYMNIAVFNDRKATFPYLFLTFSDLCFYRAEAALLGWAGLNPSQAEGFYQAGIRAAMQVQPYNIAETAIAEYIGRQGKLTGSDEEKLEQIMTQKWISLFMRNYEAYAEWRRTGYPRLTPGPNPGVTGGQIPRRGVYSSTERLRNATNYNEAASRLNRGDTYLSRVWWDKR
ncbi:SusD/RagB family nutrient-binding outer membrane lipoprotein [Rudanella lutea]|uniref:SusD/RagB family nutrient-binding outer membrane lipoprotein n=1 Tax=Rudanella lutea TaxID=451374 RepID=UPI00036BE3ED|nr:SusD/RagB family nutrient-binding outer membrane lipoprotein [Rudanella lutea]